MKRQIAHVINKCLKPLDCELVRLGDIVTPENSYMKDDYLNYSLWSQLATIAHSTIQEVFPNHNSDHIDFESEIGTLFNLYRSKPFGQNKGGSGFHNFFWIYFVTRLLKPDLIVESGVWKGHITWLFDQLAPDASILGFDIDLGYIDSGLYTKAQFHEHDWNIYPFSNEKTNTSPQTSLAFFDCHLNHARRIIEAHERGFQHILLDDNMPLNRLYIDGLPAFPSAHMLVHESFNENVTLQFCHKGIQMEFSLDIDEFNQARNLIETHHVFENVGSLTGYQGYSFLTYVKLKNHLSSPRNQPQS